MSNLVLLPFADSDDLPDLLGSSDILVTILGPDAAAFSTPSKVLGQLCASRPILAAIPAAGNSSAKLIGGVQAGVVVVHRDSAAFVREAQRLARDPARRARMGSNARAYAEQAFRSQQAAAFERILRAL